MRSAAPGRRPGAARHDPHGDDAVGFVLAACLTAWVAVALHLFLTPEPDRLTETVDPSLGHVTIFTAITATASAMRAGQDRRQRVALFLVGVLGGLVVEVAQELGPATRGFDVRDLAADALGVFLGIVAVMVADVVLGRPRVTRWLVAAASLVSLAAVTAGTLVAG